MTGPGLENQLPASRHSFKMCVCFGAPRAALELKPSRPPHSTPTSDTGVSPAILPGDLRMLGQHGARAPHL